jgi:hypothetical protein
MSDVRLPKWEPVHVDLSTDHVDREFLEDAAKKMGSGYFVVEDDDTYLLVSHRGMVCEVGVLETEDGRRNIGQAFDRVTLADIDRVLDGEGGSVSAYSLPQQVCIDLCGVINGHARYGDLNTDILELDDLLERLAEDGFDGSVMFTSDDEYALVEYGDGERVGFRYEGEGDVDGVKDLVGGTLGRMETNVFEPRDEEEVDAPTPRETNDDVEMIDYNGIAGALGDATAGISSRERFHEALEEQLSLVDGAKFDGGNVVTGAPDKADVFDAYRKAVEASAELVPPSKVYEEARDDIREMEGGNGFLAYAEG